MLSLLLTFSSTSQSFHYPLSSGYTRVGVYNSKVTDPLSVRVNQASLASLDTISAGVYSERKFLLPELNLLAIALCMPVANGGIGISVDYFGDDSYNELQAGVGYGKSLGRIALGIRFNFYSLRIAGYGNIATWNMEAGMMMHLSRVLSAGVSVLNPTRNDIGRSGPERLPVAVSAGFGYHVSELFFLQGELIKEENKPIVVHAAFQYYYASKVFLRVGMHGVLANIYCGAGLMRRSFRVDIVCTYHSRLGVTPALAVTFLKPRKA